MSELEVHVEGTEYDSNSGIMSTYSVQLLPRQSAPSRADGTSHGPTMLVDPLDLGSVPEKLLGISVPYGGGVLELDHVVDDVRNVVLTIHEVAGSEREAVASMADWNHKFRPSQAPVTIRAKWHDGTALRDVFLLGRRTQSSGFGSGAGGAQFKGRHTGGVVRMTIPFRCPWPFWRQYTASSSNVALSTTTQSVSIVNGGDVPIGARFALTSTTGTWTQITVQNTTTGPEGEDGGTLTWTSSAFAPGHEVDWKHSDPFIPTWDETLAAGSNFVLFPGPNAVEVTGVGGTGGAGTLSYRPQWEDVGN